MNEEKEKIIEFATQKFMAGGFYKTTMDQIAAEMHVSKKTIYRNFTSKEELVREIAVRFLSRNSKMIDDVVKIRCNAVEKLFKIFQTVGSIVLKINLEAINDIHHYAPDVWKEIDDLRTKKMLSFLSGIVKQGQREGYFIKKNKEIIVTIFIASLRSVVNPMFVLNNSFTMIEALRETIEILMLGILTDKGKKEFNKLKNGVIQ